MREIKFRAWDTRAKKMLTPEMLEGENYALGSNGKLVVLNQQMAKDGHLCLVDWYETMFWTGRRDKNGVEIYEGDIVKFEVFEPNHDDWAVGIVKAEFQFRHAHTVECQCNDLNTHVDFYQMDWPSVQESSFEIIGNIHENPELLK